MGLSRGERGSWLAVLVLDPLAARPSRRGGVARKAGLAAGLAAGGCFLAAPAGRGPMLAGALAYAASLLFERAAPAGRRLPAVRDLCCALGLTLGPYAATSRPAYLCLGVALLAVKTTRGAHLRLAPAVRLELGPPAAPEDETYGRLAALRDRAAARGLTLRPFDTTEYRAAVFVLAPATGLIVQVSSGALALLLCCDVVAAHLFWRARRAAGPALPEPAVLLPAARPEPDPAQAPAVSAVSAPGEGGAVPAQGAARAGDELSRAGER